MKPSENSCDKVSDSLRKWIKDQGCGYGVDGYCISGIYDPIPPRIGGGNMGDTGQNSVTYKSRETDKEEMLEISHPIG